MIWRKYEKFIPIEALKIALKFFALNTKWTKRS